MEAGDRWVLVASEELSDPHRAGLRLSTFAPVPQPIGLGL
jgi:hypothetical protein